MPLETRNQFQRGTEKPTTKQDVQECVIFTKLTTKPILLQIKRRHTSSMARSSPSKVCNIPSKVCKVIYKSIPSK